MIALGILILGIGVFSFLGISYHKDKEEPEPVL